MARQPSQNQVVPIDHFNMGGLSFSKWSGHKNSVYKLTGFDPHTLPGVLQVEQKLTQETNGTEPDEFCKAGVACSNGAQYWGSSTSGKIWERQSNGSWRLVTTVVPSAGSAAIMEMVEYMDYIYIFTKSRVHRILVSKAGNNNWSTDLTLNWAEMNLSQTVGGSGATAYALATGASETATGKQTFVAFDPLLESVSANLTVTGPGDVTLLVHDASNNAIGSRTVSAANLVTGKNYFEFTTPLNLIKDSSYHVHLYASALGGTVVTNIDSQLEGALMSLYRTSNDTYHPTHEVNLVLYIGDNNFVHQIDDGVFTAEALDIAKPLVVTSLGEINTDLLVGTGVNSSVNKAKIIRWDTYSVSFTSSDDVPEVAINAFLPADNMVLVQAGLKGNIYYYDGQNLQLYTRVPGNYSPTAKAETYYNSVAMKDGHILFGVSNNIGNPCDEGVYRLGRYSRDFDYIMDFPYPISQRSGSDFVLSGVKMGKILVAGDDLYVAWDNTNNSTSGVDKLDTANKLDGAYFESMVLIVNREAFANFAKAVIAYADLPASTDIDIFLSKNYASYTTTAVDKAKDTDRQTFETTNSGQDFTTMQLKVKARTSGNTGPLIESAALFLD